MELNLMAQVVIHESYEDEDLGRTVTYDFDKVQAAIEFLIYQFSFRCMEHVRFHADSDLCVTFKLSVRIHPYGGLSYMPRALSSED